jgi:hypothetical protein
MTFLFLTRTIPEKFLFILAKLSRLVKGSKYIDIWYVRVLLKEDWMGENVPPIEED